MCTSSQKQVLNRLTNTQRQMMKSHSSRPPTTWNGRMAIDLGRADLVYCGGNCTRDSMALAVEVQSHSGSLQPHSHAEVEEFCTWVRVSCRIWSWSCSPCATIGTCRQKGTLGRPIRRNQRLLFGREGPSGTTSQACLQLHRHRPALTDWPTTTVHQQAVQ